LAAVVVRTKRSAVNATITMRLIRIRSIHSVQTKNLFCYTKGCLPKANLLMQTPFTTCSYRTGHGGSLEVRPLWTGWQICKASARRPRAAWSFWARRQTRQAVAFRGLARQAEPQWTRWKPSHGLAGLLCRGSTRATSLPDYCLFERATTPGVDG
jgi:hypothetical protein